MPTYEYRCTHCRRTVEVYQSFTDPPLERCEACEGKLRRIFSPVGVVFKGAGFYSTDARTAAAKSEKTQANGEKPAEKPKKEGGSGTGSKGEQGSSPPAKEKKPAEKPA